jgi:hypothetical protein
LLADVPIETLPLIDLNLPTKWWGGVALFNRPDSLRLMDHCVSHGIGVLGVEGFRIEGDKIIPLMDYIIDFSELANVAGSNFRKKSVEIVVQFLKSMPEKNDILLEFLLVT